MFGVCINSPYEAYQLNIEFWTYAEFIVESGSI